MARLIDADKYPCQNCSASYCHQNCTKFIDWFNTTVEAYTGGQVDEVIRQAEAAIKENSELRTLCGFLKSCVNCKIRKECPRHCGKVIHDCDHWEYGDPLKDAMEVVRGRWEEYFGCGHDSRRCSNCHDYYTTEPETLRYCPRCGMPMEQYIRPNLSRPPEQRFPWLFPDSEEGRKWHLTTKRLPDCSGSYWAVLVDESGNSVKEGVIFNHDEKTWAVSPECSGGAYAVKYWKENE